MVHVLCYSLKGEIRATGFNDAVDKFFPILEVNKVNACFGHVSCNWVFETLKLDDRFLLLP